MGMNNRLLRPKASGHPEALAWRSAVIANGGTVSASTMTAVTAFCKSIDATAGLRACFYRLNLFCGTGLEACLVPLYRAPASSGTQYGNTTDTNSNFVSGDYVETGTTGGLAGNGSTKRLAPGLDPVTAGLSHDNTHISFYSRAQITANGRMSATNTTDWGFVLFGGLSQLFYRSGGGSNSGFEGVTWSGANRSGHVLALRTGSDAKLYRNGTDLNATVTMTNGSTTFSTNPGAPFIFARNNQGTADGFLAATLQGYSMGTAMTAAQAAAFSTAMLAFQTALGRN